MQYEDMTWSHRQDLKNLQRMSSAASDYRSKYLQLRKMIRQYAKDNDLALPQHIKKAIGEK